MLQTKSLVKMKSHENNISPHFVQYRKKEKRVQETEIIFVRIWPDVGLMTFMSTYETPEKYAGGSRKGVKPNRTGQGRMGRLGQPGWRHFFWGATQSDRVGSGRDDSLVASNGQWGIFSFAEPANYRTRTYLAGMYLLHNGTRINTK